MPACRYRHLYLHHHTASHRIAPTVPPPPVPQAYEVLELFLEMLAVRAELLAKSKEMPPDMVEVRGGWVGCGAVRSGCGLGVVWVWSGCAVLCTVLCAAGGDGAPPRPSPRPPPPPLRRASAA